MCWAAFVASQASLKRFGLPFLLVGSAAAAAHYLSDQLDPEVRKYVQIASLYTLEGLLLGMTGRIFGGTKMIDAVFTQGVTTCLLYMHLEKSRSAEFLVRSQPFAHLIATGFMHALLMMLVTVRAPTNLWIWPVAAINAGLFHLALPGLLKQY